ncbi:MAG: hypothetical protein M1829_001612 [Trizodia sp. TS-e1964]|nr:MAG: hypothetical protein M1829_001612 [Trizodia sp. TS-e1964]
MRFATLPIILLGLELFAGVAVAVTIPIKAHDAISGHIISARSSLPPEADPPPLGLTREFIKAMKYNQLMMLLKDLLAAYWTDNFPPNSFNGDDNIRDSPLWHDRVKDIFDDLFMALNDAGFEFESSNPHLSESVVEAIYKSMETCRKTVDGLRPKTLGVIAMENFFKSLSPKTIRKIYRLRGKVAYMPQQNKRSLPSEEAQSFGLSLTFIQAMNNNQIELLYRDFSHARSFDEILPNSVRGNKLSPLLVSPAADYWQNMINQLLSASAELESDQQISPERAEALRGSMLQYLQFVIGLQETTTGISAIKLLSKRLVPANYPKNGFRMDV